VSPQAKAQMVAGFAESLRAAGHIEAPAVIGIDPGILGGLALVASAPGARGRVHPMPTTKSASGRDTYDIPAVIRLIQSLAGDGPLRGHVVAYLEKGNPFPSAMGGAIANFHRGYGRGLFEGILAALGIEYHLVGPKQWQDEMLPLRGGNTGQRSIIAARKLFPGVSLYPTARSRKESDGLADALNIASFGARRLAK